MKTTTTLAALAGALAVGLALPAVNAAAVNITIPDGLNGAAFPGGASNEGEDNETEPGTVQAQKWDLEAVVYDPTTLTIVGGYDFFNGATDGAITFNSGDIFIDVDGGLIPNPPGGGTGSYPTINGNLGYDFVIKFNNRDFNDPNDLGELQSLTYDVYDIRTGTITLQGVNFSATTESNPWIHVDGGLDIGGGTAAYSSYTDDAAVNAAFGSVTDWVNLKGYGGNDDHYSLSVNLQPIVASLGVTLDEMKFTYGCGNDMIKGDFTKNPDVVPDGGLSLMLLGMSLGAVGLAQRKLLK